LALKKAHGADVQVGLNFDGQRLLTINGLTQDADGEGYDFLYLPVNSEHANLLLSAMAEADRMQVVFETGNELAWGTTMRGSRKAVQAFTACSLRHGGVPATKPFNDAPTSEAPTSPYSKANERGA
jgi:hypothetical protein